MTTPSPRLVDPAHLCGAHEVARYLGVNRVRLNNLVNAVKAPFPAPVRTLKAGQLWALPDLAQYAREHPHLIPASAPIREWSA